MGLLQVILTTPIVANLKDHSFWIHFFLKTAPFFQSTQTRPKSLKLIKLPPVTEEIKAQPDSPMTLSLSSKLCPFPDHPNRRIPSVLLIFLTSNTTTQTLPRHLSHTLSHTAKIIQTFHGTTQPPCWVSPSFPRYQSVIPASLGTWTNTFAGLHFTKNARPGP